MNDKCPIPSLFQCTEQVTINHPVGI